MNEDFDINRGFSEPVEEAYTVLRTNIQFCEADKKIKVISITSYNPGEGKTTVSMNLAISMAKAGSKVLLVDADLRKPMLLKVLKRNDFKGLTNYLLGKAALEEIINTTDIDNFNFVTCGIKPINPAELLNTGRFEEFVNTVRNMFDIVIIDTPPLGSVIDSAIVATKTDGTIIVIRQNAVKFQNAQHVKEQLERVKARILGVVLNDVEKISYKDYYNSYNYYGSQKRYVKSWLNSIKSKRSEI